MEKQGFKMSGEKTEPTVKIEEPGPDRFFIFGLPS
jgi:hypothetical protein